MKYFALIICVCVLCVSCASWVQSYDMGKITTEVGELRQTTFPVTVSAGNGMEEHDVRSAIRWWNDELRSHYVDACRFDLKVDESKCLDLPDLLVYSAESPDVIVEEGQVPTYSLERTAIIWSRTGRIMSARVILPENFWNRTALRHGLGHGAFGLKDDIQSIDLNSVMSSPILEGSHVTQRDFNRIMIDYLRAQN